MPNEGGGGEPRVAISRCPAEAVVLLCTPAACCSPTDADARPRRLLPSINILQHGASLPGTRMLDGRNFRIPRHPCACRDSL